MVYPNRSKKRKGSRKSAVPKVRTVVPKTGTNLLKTPRKTKVRFSLWGVLFLLAVITLSYGLGVMQGYWLGSKVTRNTPECQEQIFDLWNPRTTIPA